MRGCLEGLGPCAVWRRQGRGWPLCAPGVRGAPWGRGRPTGRWSHARPRRRPGAPGGQDSRGGGGACGGVRWIWPGQEAGERDGSGSAVPATSRVSRNVPRPGLVSTARAVPGSPSPALERLALLEGRPAPAGDGLALQMLPGAVRSAPSGGPRGSGRGRPCVGGHTGRGGRPGRGGRVRRAGRRDGLRGPRHAVVSASEEAEGPVCVGRGAAGGRRTGAGGPQPCPTPRAGRAQQGEARPPAPRSASGPSSRRLRCGRG